MSNLNPNETLVLCIDIDGTLIAVGKSNSVADFIGSKEDNNAQHWVDLLTRIQQRCAALNVHLIVQIITAKKGGNIDVTVDWVNMYLHAFLKPLNRHGECICCDDILVYNDVPSQYYAMFHLGDEPIKRLCDNSMLISGFTEIDITNDSLLPPIHVCFQNGPLGLTSKAVVMDIISQHFGGVIPCENMFLLDDARENENIIKNHEPVYQFISSRACNVNNREDRTKAFEALQCELEERIVAQASKIKFLMEQSQININSQELVINELDNVSLIVDQTMRHRLFNNNSVVNDLSAIPAKKECRLEYTTNGIK